MSYCDDTPRIPDPAWETCSAAIRQPDAVPQKVIVRPTGPTGPTGPAGPTGPSGAASTVEGPTGPTGALGSDFLLYQIFS